MTEQEQEVVISAELLEKLNENESNFFLENFDDETMKAFVAWADTPSLGKVIYLNSVGGHMHVANVITDKINEAPENYHIKMVGNVISAGVFLIMHAKCTVEDISEDSLDYTLYLYHNAYVTFPKTPRKDTREYYKRKLAERNLKNYMLIKDCLTVKQQKQMDKFYHWTEAYPFLANFLSDDLYLDLWQIKKIVGDRYVQTK